MWVSFQSATPLDIIRAEEHLKTTDPSIIAALDSIKAKLDRWEDEERATGAVWTNSKFLARLDKEIEGRVRKRHSLGRYFLSGKIPEWVRMRLLSGGFEVVARTPNDQDVTLFQRDLVGLSVDLESSALIGDGTFYRAVRVRPAIMGAEGGTPTEPKPRKKVSKAKKGSLQSLSPANQRVAKGGRRGPRPIYMWDEIIAGLGAKLYADGLPESGDGRQAALERWVTEQFTEKNQPCESIIREKVSRLIRQCRESSISTPPPKKG